MRPKLMSMSEAIESFVHSGETLALSGANYNRIPMAAVREIIRQEKKNLTVTKTLASFDVELLLAANLVRKIISSWASIGVVWGVSKVFREKVESGEVEFEEWSNLGINLRFDAAAMGAPYIPTFSMLGSDIPKQNAAKTVKCPYTGNDLIAVPALFPDVAILHVQKADKFGNAIIEGPTLADPSIARAAKHVVITTEEILDTSEIRRNADRTAIPFFLVDAVVWAPFGSHPYDCYGYYDMDHEHVDNYVKKVGSKGTEYSKEYLRENVYNLKDHFKYLNNQSFEQLMKLAEMSKGIKFGWKE